MPLADGASVPTWPDSSPNGYNMTATGSGIPIYKTAQINGLPVVRFDGVDDYDFVASAALQGNTTRFTIFIVVKSSILDAGPRTVFAQGSTDRSSQSIAIYRQNADWQAIMQNAGAGFPAVYDYAGARLNKAQLLTFGWDGANLSYWRDTELRGTTAAPTRGKAETSMSLGAAFAPSFYSQADIGELIAYSRYLTGAERDSVHNYLLAKWGISPPATIPVTTGLLGWWDSTQIVGVVPGGNFTPWTSRVGGSTLDMAQGTAANHPSFQSNVINGLPITRYNGTTNFFENNASLLDNPATPFAVFAVVRPTASGNYSFFSNGQAGVGHGIDCRTAYTDWMFNQRSSGGADFYATEAGSVVLNTPVLITCIWDGTNISLRRGGVQRAITALNSRGYAGTVNRIGSNAYSTGYQQFAGDIGEVALYNVVLSGADITNIESYLMNKWGV